MVTRAKLAGVAALLGLLVVVPLRAKDDPPGESLSPRSGPTAQNPDQSLAQEAAELKTIRLVYANALRVLATGSRDDAIAAIVLLERRQAGKVASPDLRRLEAAESSLARKLSELDSESLVPVMLVHHDLVEEYRRLGEFVLSDASGQRAATLAELYSAGSGDAQARSLAGGLVASLAGQAQKEGLFDGTRTLFDRALTLDPGCEPALIGLGALFEVHGRYELAVASLGQLRTAHPENWHGVLRLGVNLVRIGRHEHGIPALRSCLDKPAPEWVAVLASEELARALLAEDKPDEAAAVLTQAANRFPNQAGLLVELALALERRHRPFEARRVLARLEELPIAPELSPRLRYCKWPNEEIAAARERLAQAATSRLPALAGVLERLEPEGE